jgi:glutamyl/glutaminyl-tRNA synthetase
VLWPLRYALTGAEASPDPLTLLEIMGQEKSLKRIENAIIVLNGR